MLSCGIVCIRLCMDYLTLASSMEFQLVYCVGSDTHGTFVICTKITRATTFLEAKKNFNVACPMFDHILGTYVPEAQWRPLAKLPAEKRSDPYSLLNKEILAKFLRIGEETKNRKTDSTPVPVMAWESVSRKHSWRKQLSRIMKCGNSTSTHRLVSLAAYG